MLKIGL